jgi:diguanylate cyclase (GGDEF)-like protein
MVALLVLLPALGAAQTPSPAGAGATGAAAEIEARLPRLSGPARVDALVELTERLESDDPKKTLAYGAEALAAGLDPAQRIRVLTSLCWAHMTLSQYDQAVARGEEALGVADRQGDASARGEALNLLGSIAQRRGDPVRALDHFTHALEAVGENGSPSVRAMALNNLGFVYATDLADYDHGLDRHLKALEIRERLGDEGDVALSLNNIGIVYSRLRQTDRALEYFERALALRRKVGPAGRLAATLNNIGDAHFERGEPEKAIAAHQEALEIRKRIGDRSAETLSHRSLAAVYMSLGRLADAHRELDEGLVLSDAVGDKGLAAQVRLGLAQLDRQSGQPARAVTRAQEALAIARDASARELQRRAYEELAADLEAAGKPAEALAAYRSFKQLSDEIFDEGTARKVASLDQRYQIEKREREMERLVNTRSRQRDLAAAAFVLLALGGLAIYLRRTFTARVAERLSVTDLLTGLKNRRYVHQTIGADVAASLRRHRAGGAPADADLVFFVVDVDGFKAVNDAHGHAAGDLVLAGISRLLEAASRQSDVVARWGGEEFLVLARFTDRAQAPGQAERLRRSVEEGRFALEDGRSIQVTCSVGFAAFPFARAQPDALGWEQVVAVADHGTYMAKARGRNAWVGLGASGDVVPDGKPGRETLDGWVAEGRLEAVSSR